MDTLASRGENKINQPVKDNTLKDKNVYTGAHTKAFPGIAIGGVVFVIVLIILLSRQK